MSLELHIFMHDARIPDRAAWQQAIEQAGFPTVLYPTLDVRQDTGFSPTTYAGESTGFEFYLEPATDVLEAYPHIAERIGTRDMAASFYWGGDLMEMAAALSAGAALAKLTDGIYFDPQGDVVCSADEAMETTRRELSSL